MLITYQYRIYPTTKQRKTLETILEGCQTLYNQALAMRKQAYEKFRSENSRYAGHGESLSYKIQANHLTPLRQESCFWSSIHIDVLQDTLRCLDKAYQAFFRRAKAGQDPGFPRFKGKGRYRSMTFSHLSKKLIRNVRKRMARIVVPKIGHIAIRYHRPFPNGTIKNLTIQRKASGWYANIAVKVADVPEIEVQTTTGVDVGLESFLTTSDGDKVHNPATFVNQKSNSVKPNGYCLVVTREAVAINNKEQLLLKYMNILPTNAVISTIKRRIGFFHNVRRLPLRI